jgi:hypothetical protein
MFFTKKHKLLLPNSAITEVVSQKQLTASAPQDGESTIEWQGKTIRLVDFDRLSDNGSRSSWNLFNVVVIKKLDDTATKFGFLAAGTPSIFQANSYSLEPDLRPTHLTKYAATYAIANQQQVIIPDLQKIQATLTSST